MCLEAIYRGRDVAILQFVTFCIFDVLHKIGSFDLFASRSFLKGSICCNTWRQHKLN